MLNKFKASLPGFDVNSLLKGVKGSLTEPRTEDLDLRETPSCELVGVRDGKLPAVIIINGFMTQNGECSEDWLEIVDELYPEHKVVRVQWKAGNLKDMVFDKGVVPDAKIACGSKLGFAATLMARTNLIGMIATAGGFVVDKVIGHWKTSFHETRHVSVSLAKYLESEEQFENCILMGHSLGGRIVRHTLNELSSANKVSVAYVLAGAVSSDNEQWHSIFEKHDRLKLINCMSKKDYVLKSAYKAGTLWDHEPAGLSSVMEANENTVNLDVTEYAPGHTDYKQTLLGQYLKQQLLK
ncbi:DUF726 domain-containing protein [Vibrio sp. RE86]|uniref:DUF726 domain-containing protein n=1 Tax=Vibrio sp. RE86 TaxID=2607605 RepID=UPI001493BC14|nr:DUF726 domain-containing protein [Vibrio sp. RE86]NOH81479.1 DUF726 domain-containing protein [Vibrio sp. RE86]